MKMRDALKIIKGTQSPTGFMICFERAGDGFLKSDHFPDKHLGEPLIPTEEEAWKLARQFAEKTKGKCVNIYVVNSDFSPVIDYEEKQIKNR